MEAATPPAATGAAADYPVRFDVEYPERLSRWKIFVKWLLAIPHFIIVYLLQTVAGVMVFIAFFAILFTKKWPRGMFDFTVQIERWTANMFAVRAHSCSATSIRRSQRRRRRSTR